VIATVVITRWWAALIAAGAIVVGLWLSHVILVAHDGMQPLQPGEPVDSNRLVAERRRGIKALVIGTDGRASTSKLQALLWTFAVLFAFTFLLVWGRSAGCSGSHAQAAQCRTANSARAVFDDTIRHPLQPEYFVLLGFPLAAALAAKALTTNKVITGDLTKEPIHPDPAPAGDDQQPENNGGVLQSVGEIIGNDNGEVDLLDFQYFIFTLLTLAYFFITFLTRPSGGVPNLPPTLLALSGISVATYTTKKALETDVEAVITLAAPNPCPHTAGTVLRLLGNGFGTRDAADPAQTQVLLGGQPLTISTWTDTAVVATIPDAAAAALDGQDTAQVVVIDSDGSASQSATVALT
jgi:hypothetical protein